MARKQSSNSPDALAADPGSLTVDTRATEAMVGRAVEISAAAEAAVTAAPSLQPLAALEADVSGEIADAVPSFANILRAIGNGVASSQAALDQGVLDTIQTLSSTQIEVVTDVIQELDDDGLPVAEKTDLVTNKLSLLNFVRPAVHQWSDVALSMDFSVGAMDETRGLIFNKTQWSNNASGSYFWGFGGWFQGDSHIDHSLTVQTSRQQAEWMTGQVRLDAMLTPRDTGKLPVPAEAAIGPQIFFSLGTVRETKNGQVVKARAVDLVILVIKADGSVNPQRPIEVDAPALQVSFKTDEGFDGSTTNSDGKVMVTLTRNIPNPLFLQPVKVPIRVTLGQIVRTANLTL
jgi:hypothetical protein